MDFFQNCTIYGMDVAIYRNRRWLLYTFPECGRRRVNIDKPRDHRDGGVTMTNKAGNEKFEEGLCSTCNNASTCTLCVKRTMPVWDCDEYDGTSPVPIITAPPDNGEITLYDAVTREDETRYKGLCVDCANRKMCTHKKPEGGIWHCEDYQ
jgi:hypothetical protein